MDPNLRTETMKELVEEVKCLIKDWISKEKPRFYQVDGPWKTYVLRQLDSYEGSAEKVQK